MKYAQMKTTQVRLPGELKRAMQHQAVERGLSVQQYIRALIEADIKKGVAQ